MYLQAYIRYIFTTLHQGYISKLVTRRYFRAQIEDSFTTLDQGYIYKLIARSYFRAQIKVSFTNLGKVSKTLRGQGGCITFFPCPLLGTLLHAGGGGGEGLRMSTKI